MPELLGALILGAVQGITEFLPISSTAHLVLVPWLFGWENPLLHSLTFDVALHMGTLVAILGYFARDWIDLARGLLLSIAERRIADDPQRRLAWLVVLGTVPAVVAGALLESYVETVFRTPVLIAATLIVFGLLLAAAEHWGRKTWDTGRLTPGSAIATGIGQAMAIIPGVSRSGGTMTVAMALGMKREAAARFSFLLAAPIIGGAGLKELPDMLRAGGDETGLLAMAAGFLASAIVGYLCIKFLLRYLREGTLYVFVGYRVLLGLAVLAVVAVRGGS